MKSLGELALAIEGTTTHVDRRRNERIAQSGRVEQSQGQAAERDLKKVMKMVSDLLDQLQTEGGIDLIGSDLDEKGLQAVITIDATFLSNSALAELVDGEYTVLGKVSRFLGSDSDESINLLRKTSLSMMDDQAIEDLTLALNQTNQHGVNIPRIVTKIEAPVIQVLPIAIFA